MSFAYTPTSSEVRRRRLPASRAVSARPTLTAFDRARIEGLIARLIDLLDAYDAPMADMEQDWDHEADADAERSLQPLPLEPQPFPGGKGPHSERPHLGCGKGVHSEHSPLVLAAPPVVSRHNDAKPRLAEGKVVSHRRGSKPGRTVIEGELVR